MYIVYCIHMDDVVAYDEKYVPAAFGLVNFGSVCYFNSAIQALISCSSFNAACRAHIPTPDGGVRDAFIKKYAELCVGSLGSSSSAGPAGPAGPAKSARELWDSLMAHAPAGFRVGQQCAGECLARILDLLEKTLLSRLFEHRYIISVVCQKCNRVISKKARSDVIINIEPDVDDSINDRITTATGQLSGFKCDCEKEQKIYSDKLTTTKLVMIPEIVIVLSKKYGDQLKSLTKFPAELKFRGMNMRYVYYDAVAQIEHSGGMQSGHYWAVCRRRGGWFRIDDHSVSPSEFAPTPNTYIVLYHRRL